MAVLDVGAGTGAITAGIAGAVGPSGSVLGIDRDETMIRLAREHHAGVANLAFELLDVLALCDEARFEVVTAARALQWIEDPARALQRMHAATQPRGMVVVLEYTHADLVWEPAPPEPVRRFYDAFLAWRDANGWDNRLGDHLPALVADAGFRDVGVTVQDEVATRGDPGFADALELWQRVMESCSLHERCAARALTASVRPRRSARDRSTRLRCRRSSPPPRARSRAGDTRTPRPPACRTSS